MLFSLYQVLCPPLRNTPFTVPCTIIKLCSLLKSLSLFCEGVKRVQKSPKESKKIQKKKQPQTRPGKEQTGPGWIDQERERGRERRGLKRFSDGTIPRLPFSNSEKEANFAPCALPPLCTLSSNPPANRPCWLPSLPGIHRVFLCSCLSVWPILSLHLASFSPSLFLLPLSLTHFLPLSTLFSFLATFTPLAPLPPFSHGSHFLHPSIHPSIHSFFPPSFFSFWPSSHSFPLTSPSLTVQS